ncbi:MAG: hypothetical protein ACRDC5_06795 [Vibrio sp.]
MADLVKLDESGFSRARLPEIKKNIDGRTIQALGSVNVEADSTIGEYNGINSATADEVIATTEDVYYSQWVSTSSGESLRRAIQYVGMNAIKASFTETVILSYGNEGDFTPTGSQCSSIYSKTYITQSDVTVSRANMCEATLDVIVQNNAQYVVNIGGVNYSFTSDATATKDEINSGLSAIIPQSKVAGGKLLIQSFDQKTGVTLSVSQNITIVEIGSPVLVRAANIGKNHLAIGALTNIITPSGWKRINNPTQANQGRDEEKDWEIKARHPSAVRISGGGTEGAIKAKIMEEVEGVTNCIVIANRSVWDAPDGQFGNSIQCVVVGGLDSAVAQKVWDVKGAGVPTFGNVTQQVIDTNGVRQDCQFSRATVKYAWAKATPKKDPEKTVTSTYKSAIQNAILQSGQSLAIGNDIIKQALDSAGFNAVAGLSKLDVQIAVTNKITDTPVYGSADIPIGKVEVADFDLSRIVVLEMTY